MAVSSSKAAIVEVREEAMVSPAAAGETLTVRKAHFLKPSKDSIFIPSSNPQPLSLPSLPPNFDPRNWGFRVKFKGWRKPEENWNFWVQKMRSLHESTWKKAGIREAILNSTFEIPRNNELVFGVAEKWCNETKSFIFSWGEATITLEDVMILGGYSVLGSPAFASVEREELKEKEKKLENACREFIKTSSKQPLYGLWMKKFMDDSENEVEHEAFLVLWLSRFVFPSSTGRIVHRVFPIAIELARGNRVALAPAVLALIYRDLSRFKRFFLASHEPVIYATSVSLRAPLQLLQVWVCERFLDLQPKPNLLKIGEPRLARWNGVKVRITEARSALDKASFQWRPYAEGLANWKLPKFYAMKEMWVLSDSDHALDEEVLSFARCLRVSLLVGFEKVEVEQYLPHRVCLQFGMDQDVPESVVASCESLEIAWRDYNRPVKGLYVPSRFYEGSVTTRYVEWWKESVVSMKTQPNYGGTSGKGLKLSSKARNQKRYKKVSDFTSSSSAQVAKHKEKGIVVASAYGSAMDVDSDGSNHGLQVYTSSIPPGSPPEGKMVVVDRSADEDKDEDQLTIAELLRLDNKSHKDESQGLSNQANLSNNHSDDVNGDYHEIHMLSLEIEDRVSKLERVIERLKAAKFGRKTA